MLRELSQLSTPVGLLLLVVIPSVISALIVLAVRRRRSIDQLAENNEFAAITYPVIGLFYGVFLAFAIVIVWQSFSDAEQSTYGEVAGLTELWRNAEVFPRERTDEIRAAIRAYAEAVRDVEWPIMAGVRSDITIHDAAYDELWRVYYRYTPATQTEQAFYARSLDELNTVGTNRRQRLMYSASEMPRLLWGFLLFGAAVTLGFSYFLGTKHMGTHALTCAALASLIGFSLLLILSLQYPFAGSSGVKSTPYDDLLKVIR